MKRLAFGMAFTIACSPAVVAQEVTTELYGDFRGQPCLPRNARPTEIHPHAS